jgi:hypothetical protein
MGLGSFKEDDSSSSKDTDSAGGNERATDLDTPDGNHRPSELEQGDKMPKSDTYVVMQWEKDKAKYWHDGKMMKWETNLRRKRQFFLRQYSPSGEYKGPDPDTHWIEDFPQEEDCHHLWENHTGDWKVGANTFLKHDCGGKAIIQYPDQAWARCAGCNAVVYRTEQKYRAKGSSDDGGQDGGSESESDGGLSQFIGGT